MAAIVRVLARRVALLVPLMLGIVLFVFLVMRFSDVDPASAFFQGANPTPRQLHDFRQQNGLLDPLPCVTSTSSAICSTATWARARLPGRWLSTRSPPRCRSPSSSPSGLAIAVVLAPPGVVSPPRSTATDCPTRSSASCR